MALPALVSRAGNALPARSPTRSTCVHSTVVTKRISAPVSTPRLADSPVRPTRRSMCGRPTRRSNARGAPDAPGLRNAGPGR
jgi:hypothetical protein